MLSNRYVLLIFLFYGILKYYVRVGVLADSNCGRPIGSYSSGKIVGGYDIGYYKYPWYVALMRRGDAYCGGTLISSKHVVTAAHCFQPFFKAVQQGKTTFEALFQPVLGVYDICKKESTQKEFKVDKVHVHSRYEKMDPYYDIALMRLKQPAKGFEPCCLPKSPLNRPKEAYIAGLGDMSYNAKKATCTMHEARILVYDDDECKKMLDKQGEEGKLLEGAFCAGYLQGGIDACQGDSGGPLTILTNSGSYALLGLTSFGYECAKPGTLGIYTDVAYHLNWIRDKMGAPNDNVTHTTPGETDPDTDHTTEASQPSHSTGSISISFNWSIYPATPWELSFVEKPFTENPLFKRKPKPHHKHRKPSANPESKRRLKRTKHKH